MLRIGVATAAALLALSVAAATGAGPAKTVAFNGRIVSASGSYANLRGRVRLVLRSSPVAGSQPPAAGAVDFTLTLSGPSCTTQAIKPPRRCASLRGKLSGDARATGMSLPDTGRDFTLGGHGRVAPLGRVTASGATSSLGFIVRGRFPLSLRLTGPAGRVTIHARGPLVSGFSSPL